jgi:hypothetical protein
MVPVMDSAMYQRNGGSMSPIGMPTSRRSPRISTSPWKNGVSHRVASW